MKKYHSSTFSSKAKIRPPVLLDDRLATMWKNIEDLQETLAQEITVTDSTSQSQQKVIIKQTLECHTGQIYALKSAVEGLSRSILGSMNELYNDVKAFAGRELSVLFPRIEGLSEQFVNIESATCKNSIEMNSLRREINDRYDFIMVKLDSFACETRDLKEKNFSARDEAAFFRDELKRQEEKFKDFYNSTNEKIKGLIENTQKNLENFSELEKKVERIQIALQADDKKNYDGLVKRLKEYDETCQMQMNNLRLSVMENCKDVANCNQGLAANKEKVNEVRAELSHRIDDFWENYEIQIKKITSTTLALESKVDNYWDRFQEGLDDMSKSISQRFDAFSKTFISENRVLNDRINKGERDLDQIQRDIKNSMASIERTLLIHEERIAFISSNYR
jgi:FtsZ-binding cell division protein ZapB